MATLPNADRAVVDIEKLRRYSLSQENERGRHKARLFVAILGITADDAEALRNVLLDKAKTSSAEMALQDEYGQRYRVDFELEWRGARAMVRSA